MSNQDVKAYQIFLPIPRQKEPDTWRILQQTWKEKPSIKTFVPVSDFKRTLMQSALITSDTEIKALKYGIPEPGTKPEVLEPFLDIIFIPMVTADKAGHRIGYGGGFYDRFLEKNHQNVLKVGLSLAPLLDPVPFFKPFDQKMDYCITPFELIKFK